MKKILIALCATASVFAGVSAASAADNNRTSNLEVKATWVPGCSLSFDDGGEVDFGEISSTNNIKPQQSTFTVGCSAANQKVTVSLDKGLYGTDTNSRVMKNGDSTMQYQVYQGTENTAQVWGENDDAYGSDGSMQTSADVGDYGTDFVKAFNVRIPQQPISDFKAGQYTDTLTATLTYTPVGG